MFETAPKLMARTCLLENKRRQIVDIKSEDKLWAFIISFNPGTKVPFCLPINEMQSSSVQTGIALMGGAGGIPLKGFLVSPTGTKAHVQSSHPYPISYPTIPRIYSDMLGLA